MTDLPFDRFTVAITLFAVFLLTACRHDAGPLQKVLLEIDQMQGTRPVEVEQRLNGKQISLTKIYEEAGIELRIVRDQTDIPRTETVRLADLHALIVGSSSQQPRDDEWKVHMLLVTADVDDPQTLGIMFDFGGNDANDVPREAFAVFETAHEGMPGGIVPEVLLTTAHELAHAFNLHHTDWAGSSFTNDSTIESYSLTDSVRWSLSDLSKRHLQQDPDELVVPGPGGLEFGRITQAHADRHKASPLEIYEIVPDDTSSLERSTVSFQPSAAIRSSVTRANDVSAVSPLKLQIDAAKERYIVGEPLTLTVAVTNSGVSDKPIIGLLSPEYGFLQVLIRAPDGDEYRSFKPPVLRGARHTALTTTLAPGDVLVDEAKVFFGSQGWTFERPGKYLLKAMFPADTTMGGDVIQSEVMELQVESPPSETTTRARNLLLAKDGRSLGKEQGLFLYMGGGNHLTYATDSLRKLVTEVPQAAHSDAVKVALANEALSPTIDQQQRRKPDARLDEAMQYLRSLQQSDEVPGITLMRAQQYLIKELEAVNRNSDAESVTRDLEQQLASSKDLDKIDRRVFQ